MKMAFAVADDADLRRDVEQQLVVAADDELGRAAPDVDDERRGAGVSGRSWCCGRSAAPPPRRGSCARRCRSGRGRSPSGPAPMAASRAAPARTPVARSTSSSSIVSRYSLEGGDDAVRWPLGPARRSCSRSCAEAGDCRAPLDLRHGAVGADVGDEQACRVRAEIDDGDAHCARRPRGRTSTPDSASACGRARRRGCRRRLGHRSACGVGRRADVGEHEQVGGIEKRVVRRQRLRIGDVESSTALDVRR